MLPWDKDESPSLLNEKILVLLEPMDLGDGIKQIEDLSWRQKNLCWKVSWSTSDELVHSINWCLLPKAERNLCWQERLWALLAHWQSRSQKDCCSHEPMALGRNWTSLVHSLRSDPKICIRWWRNQSNWRYEPQRRIVLEILQLPAKRNCERKHQSHSFNLWWLDHWVPQRVQLVVWAQRYVSCLFSVKCFTSTWLGWEVPSKALIGLVELLVEQYLI